MIGQSEGCASNASNVPNATPRFGRGEHGSCCLLTWKSRDGVLISRRTIRQAKKRTAGTCDMIAKADHLKIIEQRLLWLSHWMIHNANHLRPKADGIKVGGHQASSASMVS